jgi:hypothetical protein
MLKELCRIIATLGLLDKLDRESRRDHERGIRPDPLFVFNFNDRYVAS